MWCLVFFIQKNLGRAVSRILSTRVALRRGSFICCDLTRSLNRFRFGGGPPRALYLALHPMGFAVPPRLRSARWALTPPFHPYPGRSRGGIFSVALSVNPPSRVGRPSVSPAEPGLRGIVSCGVRTFLSQLNGSDPPPFQGAKRISNEVENLKDELLASRYASADSRFISRV